MSTRNIHQILTNINDVIAAGLNYSNNDFHGLAVLQPKDGIYFPMVRTTTQEAMKISPLDTKAMQFYHRMVESSTDTIPGKGADNYQIITYRMILVGVGFRRNVSNEIVWDNEDRAREVMNILAVNTSLQSREMLIIEGQTDTDKLTVLNNEYAGNDVLKTRVLDLLAFSISYTIKQRAVCAPAPNAPINLVAVSNEVTGIDLAWDSIYNSFGIERSIISGGGFVQIGTSTLTSYEDATVISGTTYYYRVRVLSGTNSGYSNEASTIFQAVDPDAQAWIDLMTSPTAQQTAAINTFVIADKAAGHWALRDYLLLPCLGAANGLIDAFGKSAIGFGGLTWTSNGVVFNGTNGYISTGFNPFIDGVNFALDDNAISIFVYEFDNGIIVRHLYGAYDGSNRVRMQKIPSNFITSNNNNLNLSVPTAGTISSTLYVNRRTASNITEFIIDGASGGSSTVNSVAIPNIEMNIGNSTGVASAYFNGTVPFFSMRKGTVFNESLDDTNIRNLLTDLGITL
jgi:hypothetical protein